jgi:glycosyltransferase involved in cell wall biosynthesis
LKTVLNKLNKHQKNIVLHDIFDIRGGGERLALSIARGLKADLCFGKRSKNSFDLNEMHDFEKYDLGLILEFAGIKTWRLANLFRKNTDFLKSFENVIYSGIVCPLAVHNHKHGNNYYYCHTPPRFVYDKYEHYLSKYSLPQRIVLKLLVSWFKSKYEESVSLMDTVFANSLFVKQRIKKYLNRESIVIYPPCNTNAFYNKAANGYYLSTARFDPLKRVDKIIEAFQLMPDKKLVLCSTGSEEQKLKKMAEGYNNIQFTGLLSEKELSNAIAESIATLYIPLDEDFGMSPVESMAAGKPVICSGHGGPTESVVDGETGLFIHENDIIASLCENVAKIDLNKAEAMRLECENRALLFSEEKFHNKLKHFIN